MRAVCMARDLLDEQDLRTNTPQRWWREQLMASTRLVCPSPLGQDRYCQRSRTLA